LKAVESAATDADPETATAAVRALAAWTDADADSALLHLAATSANAKHRTLALRGLAKRFEANDSERRTAFALWRRFRKHPSKQPSRAPSTTPSAATSTWPSASGRRRRPPKATTFPPI
jgi:hypothetical protein